MTQKTIVPLYIYTISLVSYVIHTTDHSNVMVRERPTNFLQLLYWKLGWEAS